MLLKTNTDYTTLVTGLLPSFKKHLRIEYDFDDESIKVYLAGAIDAISTYSDVDVFLSEYTYEYVEGERIDTVASEKYMDLTRHNVSNVIVTASDDSDVTDSYTIDNQRGIIYPSPSTSETVKFSSGYLDSSEIEPNLRMIIFRYGAFLHEMRESIQVGEPKNLPDWVTYALASIWKSRV